MADQQRTVLAVIARGMAVAFGLASAVLAVYAVMAGYAAATFDSDGLPGPVVLSMAAIGIGLGALLFGGLAHILWRTGKRMRAGRGVSGGAVNAADF